MGPRARLQNVSPIQMVDYNKIRNLINLSNNIQITDVKLTGVSLFVDTFLINIMCTNMLLLGVFVFILCQEYCFIMID